MASPQHANSRSSLVVSRSALGAVIMSLTLVQVYVQLQRQTNSYLYESRLPDAATVIPSKEDQPHLLESLISHYGSDKGHDDHGYTDFYQMILDPIRHVVRNMTEVGVSAGQSIQAWYHYFPHAQIYAYDVTTMPSTRQIVEQLSDRVHYNETNLLHYNHSGLSTELGLHNNTMDLIIDDATHMLIHQQLFLEKLFCLVKPGGYYVIEDISE